MASISGMAVLAMANTGGVASRKAYDEFLATWKDADPDNIPILHQAKAEYYKLIATASVAAYRQR